MVSQVSSARCENPENQPSMVNSKGRLFTTFDIHRYGLARAYLLSTSHDNDDMAAKVSDRLCNMATEGLDSKVEELSVQISDMTLASKNYWKPSSCTLPRRRVSPDDVTRMTTSPKPRTPPLERPKSTRSQPNPSRIDKLYQNKPTAEMDLDAKDCIESNPDFKLMFVPGYEIEEPDAYYEDPVPEYITSGFETDLPNVPDDLFLQRVLAIGRLDFTTSSMEEKQQKLEALSKMPRYPLPLKAKFPEVKSSPDSPRVTRARVGKNPREKNSDDNTSISSARSVSKHRKSKKKQLTSETANKSPATSYTADEKQLAETEVNRDSYDILSESVSIIQKNGLLHDLNKAAHQTGKTTKKGKYTEASSIILNSSLADDLNTSSSATSKPLKHGKKKRLKNSNKELKPTKFYDITEIAASYEIPCEEKLKEELRVGRRSLASPGKSFFSQRRDSLTRQRPVSAVKKKTSVSKLKRPKTAVPGTVSGYSG